jgi:hypothetical protein
MNGLSHLEPPDYSEFVEVDPTGRYGRVHLSLSLCACVFLLWNELWVWFWGLLLFFLQYNEILGRGASKIVYESKFLFLINLMESHLVFFFHMFGSLVFFAWIWWMLMQYFCKSWSLFGSFYEFLVTVSFLIGAVIEHLMSTKGLKLLGTRSSYMISYKVLKILKDSTVRFISLRHWSIRT